MSRLRQPIAGRQAILLVLSAIAFSAAQHLAGRLTPSQFLVVVLLLEFVVQPFSTLIHELGHALAARHLGAPAASIMVGRGPWAQFSVRRIRVNFSLLPSRGVMIRGVCRYDASAIPWRSRAVIALSGPLATFLELMAGVGIAATLWHRAGPFERNVIALSLFGLLSSLVVNLAPVNGGGKARAAIIENDGVRARAALRRHRQGAPPVASAPAPAKNALPQPVVRATPAAGLAPGSASAAGGLMPPAAIQVRALSEAQADRERSRTSVPPPGI